MSNPTDHLTAVSPATVIKRHPFRGLLAALPLAIGLVVVLIVTKTIQLSLAPIIITFAIVLAIGLLWGTYGPAREPKGEPPSPRPIATGHVPSRFDDFTDRPGDTTDAETADGSAHDQTEADD